MTELLQTIILGLLVGGVYALLASGLTLIFGVMNVINVAHGAFLILAAFVTWSVWSATGLDPLAAVVITTPLMFGFGWLLYNATIRPIRLAPPSSSVLLTFSLALVIEGVMGLVWATRRTPCARATSTSRSGWGTSSCPSRRSTGACCRSRCSAACGRS